MAWSVSEVVAVALPAVAALAWLLGLEARIRSVQRDRDADLARLAEQREADARLMNEQRASDARLTNERLATITASLADIREQLTGMSELKAKVDQIRSFIRGQDRRSDA